MVAHFNGGFLWRLSRRVKLSRISAISTGPDANGNPIQQSQANAALTNPYASSTNVNAGPYGNPYATTTPGLNTSDTVNNSNFYNDQSIEYAQENQLQGKLRRS